MGDWGEPSMAWPICVIGKTLPFPTITPSELEYSSRSKEYLDLLVIWLVALVLGCHEGSWFSFIFKGIKLSLMLLDANDLLKLKHLRPLWFILLHIWKKTPSLPPKLLFVKPRDWWFEDCPWYCEDGLAPLVWPWTKPRPFLNCFVASCSCMSSIHRRPFEK